MTMSSRRPGMADCVDGLRAAFAVVWHERSSIPRAHPAEIITEGVRATLCVEASERAF